MKKQKPSMALGFSFPAEMTKKPTMYRHSGREAGIQSQGCEMPKYKYVRLKLVAVSLY